MGCGAAEASVVQVKLILYESAILEYSLPM